MSAQRVARLQPAVARDYPGAAPSLRIGILGAGAIGRYLLRAVLDGRAGNVGIAGLADQAERRTDLGKLAAGAGCQFTTDPLGLPEMGATLVVEAASQEAVHRYGAGLLDRGVDLLVMSVGALGDADTLRDMLAAAERTSRRIYVPAGAIGGMDLLRAAGLGRLHHVSLVTRKPPTALAVDPAEQQEQTVSPKVLFDGSAGEAVRKFPYNINVAATLSLAGLGFEDTHVTIVADPSAVGNMHEIRIEGDFGKATISIANQPDPSNPRTSRLAALAALSVLKRLGDTLQIG